MALHFSDATQPAQRSASRTCPALTGGLACLILDALTVPERNRALVEHAQQAGQEVRRRTPALPRIERSRDFLDLVGACFLFVASVGRVPPGLRDHWFTEDEPAAVARVRATAHWLEAAIESGT